MKQNFSTIVLFLTLAVLLIVILSIQHIRIIEQDKELQAERFANFAMQHKIDSLQAYIDTVSVHYNQYSPERFKLAVDDAAFWLHEYEYVSSCLFNQIRRQQDTLRKTNKQIHEMLVKAYSYEK